MSIDKRKTIKDLKELIAEVSDVYMYTPSAVLIHVHTLLLVRVILIC